jgi:protein-arginine kinase activator protein McsA
MNSKTAQNELVDLVASGYEWICPHCELLNKEIEALDMVTCSNCGRTFEANPPEHALP